MEDSLAAADLDENFPKLDASGSSSSELKIPSSGSNGSGGGGGGSNARRVKSSRRNSRIRFDGGGSGPYPSHTTLADIIQHQVAALATSNAVSLTIPPSTASMSSASPDEENSSPVFNNNDGEVPPTSESDGPRAVKACAPITTIGGLMDALNVKRAVEENEKEASKDSPPPPGSAASLDCDKENARSPRSNKTPSTKNRISPKSDNGQTNRKEPKRSPKGFEDGRKPLKISPKYSSALNNDGRHRSSDQQPPTMSHSALSRNAHPVSSSGQMHHNYQHNKYHNNQRATPGSGGSGGGGSSGTSNRNFRTQHQYYNGDSHHVSRSIAPGLGPGLIPDFTNLNFLNPEVAAAAASFQLAVAANAMLSRVNSMPAGLGAHFPNAAGILPHAAFPIFAPGAAAAAAAVSAAAANGLSTEDGSKSLHGNPLFYAQSMPDLTALRNAASASSAWTPTAVNSAPPSRSRDEDDANADAAGFKLIRRSYESSPQKTPVRAPISDPPKPVETNKVVTFVTPEYVTFPGVQCVDLACEALMEVFNPSPFSIQVVATITRAGMEKSNTPLVECPFSVEGAFMIDSNSSENLKVTFRTVTPGDYTGELTLTAQPVHGQPGGAQSRTVKLKASSDHPDVRCILKSHEGSNCPEISSLYAPTLKPGSSSQTHVVVENRSRVSTRLLIYIHSSTAHCLSVTAFDNKACAKPLHKIAFDIHGRIDTEPDPIYDNRTLTLQCHIPQSCRDAEVSSQIAIYASSGGETKYLTTLMVHVPLTQPKLYIPSHAQDLEFHKQALTQRVPVKNCTNKVLQLTVRCNNPAFIVNPPAVEVPPYTHHPIAITFDQSTTREQASVVITVEPEGPVYTVNVDGKSKNTTTLSSHLVLSNVPYLFFPSVACQSSSTLFCYFRNSSSLKSINWRFSILGNTRHFSISKIVNTSTGKEVSNPVEGIQPLQVMQVFVTFTPSKASFYTSCLAVEPKIPKSSETDQAFYTVPGHGTCLPLYGYGGRSQIRVSVKRVQVANRAAVVSFRNIGDRSSFVLITSDHATAATQSLVVHPGSEAMVGNLLPSLGDVAQFTWGDVILKAIFNKCCSGKCLPAVKKSVHLFLSAPCQDFCKLADNAPDNVLLDPVNLTESIHTTDFPLYVSTISKLTGSDLYTDKENMRTRRSVSCSSSIECLSPPPLSPLSGLTSWLFSPDTIVINTSGGQRSSSFAIMNNSLRSLVYDLSWPGHQMSVKPAEGTIPPRTAQKIMVTATDTCESPWTGCLSVKCDNFLRHVNVVFNQDFADDPQEMLEVEATDKLISFVSKDLNFPDTRAGEWIESSLMFRNCSGEKVKWVLSAIAPCFVLVACSSSESPSSGVSLHRTMYPVFRMAKMSGFLDVNESTELVVEFAPADAGRYTQHWELEVSKRASTRSSSRRTRLLLSGVGLGYMPGREQSVVTKRLSKIELPGELSPSQKEKVLVFATESTVTFEDTPPGGTSKQQLIVKNSDVKQHYVKFLSPESPFHVNHDGFELSSRRYVKLPLLFKPTAVGRYSALFIMVTDTANHTAIPVMLQGVCTAPPPPPLPQSLGSPLDSPAVSLPCSSDQGIQ